VLGTAHAGLDGHAFAATAKGFETPFGPLEVDRAVLDAVVRRVPDDLFAAELAHRNEHSVEFQAVWLEYLKQRRGGGERRIVPLLTSFAHEHLVRGGSPAGQPEIERVLDALRDAMATVPRRYCVVAGADLAHVGPRFGDEWRVGRSELARVEAEDRALLDHVARGNAEGFFAEAVRQQDRNRICGLSPIYGLLRLQPGGAGRLLHYGELRGRGASAMTSSAPGPTGDPGLSGVFRIDRDGTWRHEGVEVTHPGVLRNLFANLRAEGETYYLQTGPWRVPVQVDDTPFVVVRIEARARPDAIEVYLSDGSQEPLDIGSLVLDGRGIPYCRVKGGNFRARLSVSAWLQLAENVKLDPTSGEAVFTVGDHRLVLRQAE
jgi:AmmeMemoRadiSam system protein B